MIITPPTKEIKDESDIDKKVKTEQDWLKLPRNKPTENYSIGDPNVHPRLIHKDGSVCHSKMYWASLNKKPPLKEFELRDLFSDMEETGPPVITTVNNHTVEHVVTTENIGGEKDESKTLQVLDSEVNTENSVQDVPNKGEVDPDNDIRDEHDTDNNNREKTETKMSHAPDNEVNTENSVQDGPKNIEYVHETDNPGAHNDNVNTGNSTQEVPEHNKDYPDRLTDINSTPIKLPVTDADEEPEIKLSKTDHQLPDIVNTENNNDSEVTRTNNNKLTPDENIVVE